MKPGARLRLRWDPAVNGTRSKAAASQLALSLKLSSRLPPPRPRGQSIQHHPFRLHSPVAWDRSPEIIFAPLLLHTPHLVCQQILLGQSTSKGLPLLTSPPPPPSLIQATTLCTLGYLNSLYFRPAFRLYSIQFNGFVHIMSLI